MNLKQKLDLQNWQSMAIIGCSLVFIILRLFLVPFNVSAIISSLIIMTHTLYTVYTLACYRNGGCNVLSVVTTIFVIFFLILAIFLSSLQTLANIPTTNDNPLLSTSFS